MITNSNNTNNDDDDNEQRIYKIMLGYSQNGHFQLIILGEVSL